MTRNSRFPSLPFEIQDKILSQLPFCESLRLNVVCKEWHSMVVNWFGLYTTLSSKDKDNIATGLTPSYTHTSGRLLKRLWLKTQNEEHMQQVLDFLVSEKCINICEVAISAAYILYDQFSQLATLCASKMTYISITQWNDEEDIITPDKLIVACPNLTKLCYSGPMFQVQDWEPVLEDQEHKCLVDLKLDIHDTDGEFKTGLFLKAVPNLQHLSLNFESIEFTNAELPVALGHYCPKLTSLVLVNGVDFRESQTHVSSKKKTKKAMRRTPDYPELNYLVLNELRGSCSVRRSIIHQLTTILCGKLETLDLSGQKVINEEGITHLSSLTFSSLKHLVLRDRPRPRKSRSALSSFIMQSVPNIVQLSLFNLAIVNNAMLGSLAAGARFLQQLTVDSCISITSLGVVGFMDAIHSQGRSLKKVILRSMPAVTLNLLVDIAKFKPVIIDELAIYECSKISIDDFKVSLRKHTPYRCTKKLDINFNFRTSRQFPSEKAVLKILKRLDSRLAEWKFSLLSRSSSPYFKIYPHSYKEISHIEFRKKNKRQQQRQ